jgi:uncharacterized protein YeaO (DUF488 family)
MIINVANFSSKLPHKLSIANSMPKGVRLLTVKQIFPTLAAVIVPSWGLVSGYKEGRVSWAAYTRIYQENLARVDLRNAMRDLCIILGHEEITLCCWEGADVEECHRKLLYDALPRSYQGVRE